MEVDLSWFINLGFFSMCFKDCQLEIVVVLHLFFLPNFPGPTFITSTSIPESREAVRTPSHDCIKVHLEEQPKLTRDLFMSSGTIFWDVIMG